MTSPHRVLPEDARDSPWPLEAVLETHEILHGRGTSTPNGLLRAAPEAPRIISALFERERILAFLQNGWYYNPERTTRMFMKMNYEQRAESIGYGLFAGCQSGRVLRNSLNEIFNVSEEETKQDIADTVRCRIRWENASTFCGGKASDYAPPELEHIRRCLDAHRPTIVLSFGKCSDVVGVECVSYSLRENQQHFRRLNGKPMIGDLPCAWDLEPPKPIQHIAFPHPVSREKGSSRKMEEGWLKLKRILQG